ncbi:MAG: hypothetical protein AAGI17_01005 [Planctomycetota bacterium]
MNQQPKESATTADLPQIYPTAHLVQVDSRDRWIDDSPHKAWSLLAGIAGYMGAMALAAGGLALITAGIA